MQVKMQQTANFRNTHREREEEGATVQKNGHISLENCANDVEGGHRCFYYCFSFEIPPQSTSFYDSIFMTS